MPTEIKAWDVNVIATFNALGLVLAQIIRVCKCRMCLGVYLENASEMEVTCNLSCFSVYLILSKLNF